MGKKISDASISVHTSVISHHHKKSESQRVQRLAKIATQANGIATMAPEKAFALIAELQRKITQEAAEVEEAQTAALDAARKGFLQAAMGKGADKE